MTGPIREPLNFAGNCDRSPSIRDVARAAGVSYQTVSRVINEHPNVSDTTRAAVLATIAQLGFRPNRAARALAGGPAQAVTVLGSNTTLYGFAAALEGIEEATREVGFGMGFRAVEARSPADIPDVVERAIEPAGTLIVIAFDKPGALALECVPLEVPTVAMIQAPTEGAEPTRPSVWIDEFAAAKEATEYLLALGHPTVHHLPIPSWPRTTRRMEGWRAALAEAGVRMHEPLQGGWTSTWGYEAGAVLARDPNVTAVLCGNDDIALGAIAAMRDAGKRVPADVSIVGFDDIPYAQFFAPPLTTVRQDFKALGRAAFAKLLEISNSPRTLPPAAAPQARLIMRHSVAPAPQVAPSASEASGSEARSPPPGR